MRLRPATLEDSDFLFRLRNDEAVRAASVFQHPVPRESHDGWLKDALADPRIRLWVADVNYWYRDRDGTYPHAVGTLRFDLGLHLEMRNGYGVRVRDASVSLTVAPELRGHGFGGQMLSWANEAGRGLGLERLTAIIRPDNARSLVLFIKAGYRPVEVDGRGFVHVRKDLPAGQKEEA